MKSIWDTENNITTESVILDYKSNRNYSWRCNKCQLSYRESINVVLNRYLGDTTSIDNICPSCNKLDVPYVENNISETHPHLLKEWDYRNNMLLGNPENHTENSKQQVWWICNNNPEHAISHLLKTELLLRKEIKSHVRYVKDLEENELILFNLRNNKTGLNHRSVFSLG
ncbi:zinc-ribbon domain-containing protein [Streptococcus suis]